MYTGRQTRLEYSGNITLHVFVINARILRRIANI